MALPGPSDYRSQREIRAPGDGQGIRDQVSRFGEHAETMVEELAAAVRERPYTTLAIAAGLAFAVGAVWKIGHRRPQTRLESLRARMPDVRGQMADMPKMAGLLPRSWR